jgi:SAM-dependent methyltransferase
MAKPATHAPGVPADYYARIHELEEHHWWYRGMRLISAALLGPRLRSDGQRILDAGCGTGGYLRWLIDTARPAVAAGADVASAAIELARRRVPEADLRVAALARLPFTDGAFDLVVVNDVLQHVPEPELEASVGELRRVLAPGGALLVRTNGAARLRRERDDWRAYDRDGLRRDLERAGLRCERLTYANFVLSSWGLLRRRVPHAPSADEHGMPRRAPSALEEFVGYRFLAAEARFLAGGRRRLPYGHTLFALAVAPNP